MFYQIPVSKYQKEAYNLKEDTNNLSNKIKNTPGRYVQ